MRQHVTVTTSVIVLSVLLVFSLGGVTARVQETATPLSVVSETPTATVQPADTSTPQPQQATTGKADGSWAVWAAIISPIIALFGISVGMAWRSYKERMALFDRELESKDQQILSLRREIDVMEREMQRHKVFLEREGGTLLEENMPT